MAENGVLKIGKVTDFQCHMPVSYTHLSMIHLRATSRLKSGSQSIHLEEYFSLRFPTRSSSLLVALKWIMLLLVIGVAAMAGWYGAAAIRGLFL